MAVQVEKNNFHYVFLDSPLLVLKNESCPVLVVNAPSLRIWEGKACRFL